MSEEQTEGVKATADDVEAGSADTSESGIQEQPEVEEEKFETSETPSGGEI